MSIESFFNAYPADADFVPSMSKRREFGSVSPVRQLANIIIQEGGRGLKEIREPLAHADQTMDKIKQAQLIGVRRLNVSAIVLGASVIAIETILSKGHFDQEEFTGLIETGYIGFKFKPKGILNPKQEPLTQAQMLHIGMIAILDRTFSMFFNDGLDSLPLSLQKYLRESSTLPTIRKIILPMYTERANLLVENNRRLRRK